MDNLKEFESANGQGKSQKVTIIILTVLLIIMTGLYLNEHFKKQEVKVELVQVETAKDTLTAQYQTLLHDFENIETSNDSISAQLEQEKEHIKQLMEELKTTKSNNKAQMNKLKKELKTCKDIMKSFVRQIDSLNTLNIALTEENIEVKKQVSAAKQENKKLTQKYEESQAKVAKASVIKAIDVSMACFNEKGKPATKAKKTKRLAINFTLDENAIAPQGTKNVYVRITSPEGLMLLNKDKDTFKFEDDKITFSALRQVEYKGEKEKMVIYYECEEGELQTGVYKTDIFCDGSMIGSTEITLK